MTEQEKLELKQEIKEELLLDIKGESQSVDTESMMTVSKSNILVSSTPIT